jgi:hypothetical protein
MLPDLAKGPLYLRRLFIGHVRPKSCFISEALALKTLWWFLLLVSPILSSLSATQGYSKRVSTWRDEW